MQVLKLTSRFTLVITLKKSDREKVMNMLHENNIVYTRLRQHPMDGFVELRCDVNLRKAEIIRQLMKNIKVYD
jgi:hypothetical protein